MPKICFYLFLHQPYRVQDYGVFHLGQEPDKYCNYFGRSDDDLNKEVFKKVADKSYRPMLSLLLKLVEKYPDFRVSLSATGVFLEQAEAWGPDVIEILKKLAKKKKQVEFLAETYYHSLSALYSPDEFRAQVRKYMKRIKELLGVQPTTFRNTEMIYDNRVGKLVAEMGFDLLLTEGVDQFLEGRTRGQLFRAAEVEGWGEEDDVCGGLGEKDVSDGLGGEKKRELLVKKEGLLAKKKGKTGVAKKKWGLEGVVGSGKAAEPPLFLLLKNAQLSDDIAFRFGQKSWESYPLTAETYLHWLDQYDDNEVINLFMDFETFGEHQWEETGIFDFFEDLVKKVVGRIKAGCREDFFVTPKEMKEIALEGLVKMGVGIDVLPVYNVTRPISWADQERDISAWAENEMQKDTAEKLYGLEEEVKGCGDKKILEDWRKLTTSDHSYYMCTKYFNDGDVHAYFSGTGSPFEAYRRYCIVLADLEERLRKKRGANS